MNSKLKTIKSRPRNEDLVLQPLIIAAEGGRLYHYDFAKDRLGLVFEEEGKETLMGLAKEGQCLYVGAKTRIYKLELNKNNFYKEVKSSRKFLKRKFSRRKRDADFHQMDIIDGYLYITATGFNEIFKMDLGLNLVKYYKVKPPRRFFPIRYKWNYNHINNIFFHNDRFYVCLNWLTSTQYGPSGIAVLNEKMEELERFEYGWETHNFSIINNDKYVLCGTSGAIRKINNPHRSGLMVNGKLVFEHEPSSFFCKDFSMDDSFIYLVGGSVNKRDQRNKSCGVIFVLDRNYSLVKEKIFSDSGGFCGCLAPGKDLTKIPS